MIGADTTFLVELAIVEHDRHDAARALLRRLIEQDERIALSPQTLSEFIHVATDSRRFERPFPALEAIDMAERWWNARQVVHVLPSAESTSLFLRWMREHKLGRKRLLDTRLAADLWSVGVRRIVSTNARDFEQLGFEVVVPA